MVAILFALLGAAALVFLGDLRAAALPAVGVMLVWGAGVVALPRPRWGAGGVLLAALLVRAVLLASPASLSDDLFRYLWEGRFVSMGGNPYLVAPAQAVAPGDPILPLVNHPELTTIYPPVAMWVFAGLARAWYDPLAVKLLMGGLDALTAWALASALRVRGRRLDGAWLYALMPLGAVESAGSGHVEALALLLLVLAIRAWDRGGSGLGWASLGGMVKLLPAVLVPALWRRSPWILGLAAAAVMATAWPFRDAGAHALVGFAAYAGHWSFNAGLFAPLDLALGSWARPVGVALGALVSAWALLRRRDPAQVALWVGGAFVLLSPTVHPWYVAWAWVPALLCGVRAWTLLALLVPVSYVVLASYEQGTWSEPWWPPLVEYPLFLTALLWESVSHAIRPGPWAPGRAATPSP